MKTYTFVTLLLFAVIVLPAFGQQANSGSSAQPTASATQTTPASPGVTATGEAPLTWTREDFWDGDEPGFAALVLHPLASKGYVQRQTVPIRDRLNDLEQIATAHGDKGKEIDGRTQQGVQLASTKTNEGDQHALDASNKAQMAQQAAGAVDTHLSKVEPVVANVDQYKADAETVIRFRPGQTVLSKDAKSALDEMASPLKDQHGYVIEVQGFSSGQGQAAIAASRRMADSVARYLILNHEVPAYRIYTVGMGNAPVAGAVGTAAKHKGGSRVAISVLKNGPAQMASTPSSGAPPK